MTVNKTELTVSNKTVLRVLAMIVLAFLGVRAIQALAHPITLILISFFLACALNPAVHWISSKLKKPKRGLAIGIAFLTVLVVLSSFFALVIPPLVKQVGTFVQDVPAKVQDLKTQDSPVGRSIRRYNLDDQLDSFAHDIRSNIDARPVLNLASQIGGIVVSILAVLAMTFMMLNEGPSWAKKLEMLQPANKRAHRKRLVGKMYGMVTGFVNGQFILSIVAGFATLVMLIIASSVVGVSVNAVALAGIMAIFGLIPLIGNPLGAITVVLACMLTSFNLAIIVGIYFVVYNQIENVTLQPYIQSKQNELTPLTVFVSALLGVSFGGIIGALFAIPVAGCLRIIVIDWTEKRNLITKED